jgi:3-hydroxyisobutyrate dehydrogenase-like beta-hydroxyacid dehydrogenase
VLGLGDMGSALARAFLANRHSVTVWNRSESKTAPLVHAGARQAKSVEDAAAASDVIVVCVIDYAVSNSLLDSPAVLQKLRGKTVVQLTSGTPNSRAKQRHGRDVTGYRTWMARSSAIRAASERNSVRSFTQASRKSLRLTNNFSEVLRVTVCSWASVLGARPHLTQVF